MVVKGCTSCPYAGHIELKECPDAYTEVSKYCEMYDKLELKDRDEELDELPKPRAQRFYR